MNMDVEVLVRIIMSVYVLSDNDVIGVYCYNISSHWNNFSRLYFLYVMSY